ncbi:MAG: FkbM family methyltransferase [Micropepsaceae bacterium]
MTAPASEQIIRVETAHGPMWVFKSDIYVSRSLEKYGEYVSAETEVFRQAIRPGMTVVEVGANIGSHSVFLARACAPGPFYAFEPQQRVFQLLATNVTINGVTNALVYPEGLGETAGFIEIAPPNYGGKGNFGSVSLSQGTTGGGNKLRVRVSTLDSWELGACHFLKIDVEGWEIQVIQGGTETIRKCRPVIYVENDRAQHQGRLIEQISKLDYRLYWHVAPLFSPNNFRGDAENIFGNTASLNMLCMPREQNKPVTGLELIDPENWTSPFKL